MRIQACHYVITLEDNGKRKVSRERTSVPWDMKKRKDKPLKQTKKSLMEYLRLVQNENWDSLPVIKDEEFDTLHPLIISPVLLDCFAFGS